ncbi:AAA family ATPase [Saccharothrix sp. HUAS TT1]|uniref:AAA family ATPase n=1 Tax=unclassified Saccharothrix TaxID=2593673 RepID=UPI00345B7D38
MVSLDDVAADLRVLRRRGFGELGERTLAARLPTLASAARRVYDVPADRPAPVRRLVVAAGKQVAPAELRPAVDDLFGLADTFGRNLSYRQDAAAARFTPTPAPSTFRQAPQYTRRLVESLAAAVVGLVSGATLTELRRDAAVHLVDRPALVERGLALIGDGARLLWVRGEPGTGKTVLADQLAERLAHPVVRIRLGNSRVTDEDLLRAVGEPHVDGAARWELFRRGLAEGGSTGLVILDDADSPAAVSALGLEGSRVPVVVTSRTAGPEGVPELVVGNLDPEDAERAVRVLLPDLGDEHTARLARLTGGRPLVIGHVCRYLRGAALDAGTVLDGLEQDTGRALDAIDATTDRGLTPVYRAMLAGFAALGDVTAVLDTLLWIAVEGLVPRSVGRAFLAHRFPGPVGAVLVSTAEVVLARHGLVAVRDDAFVLHALTAEVLCRLRRESMAAVLSDFFDFLRLPPPERPVTDERGLMHAELTVTAGLVEGGDLLCLGTNTWISMRRRADGSRSVTVHRLHPTGVNARVDGGESRAMEGRELAEWDGWTGDYGERCAWMYGFRAERDAEPTEHGDGHVHKLPFHPEGPVVDRGFTEARCGRRWRVRLAPAQAEGLPACPRCAGMSWREPLRAWADLGVTTTRRRLLADFGAAVAAGDVPRALELREQVDRHVERTRALLVVPLVRQLAEADTALAGLVRPDDPERALALHVRAANRYELCLSRVDGDDRYRVLDELAGALASQTSLLPHASTALDTVHARLVEVHREQLTLRPDDVWARDLLGVVLARQADLVAAEDPAATLALFDEPLSLHRDALAREGRASSRRFLADLQSTRAGILRRLGRPDAVAAAREAAEHYRVLVADDPTVLDDLIAETYRVAFADRDSQSPEALARWEELEANARRSSASDPDDPRKAHALGVILTRHAHALRGQVDPERAARLRAEATSLLVALPDRHPDDVRTSSDAARTLALLAEAETADHDPATRAALALFHRHLLHRPDDAEAAHAVGTVSALQASRLWNTDPEASAHHYEQAVTWFRTSLERRPGHPATLYHLAFASHDHANLVSDADRSGEAVEAIRDALAALPGDTRLLRALAVALAVQADLLCDKGDREGAAVACDEALALCRSFPADLPHSLDTAWVLAVGAIVHGSDALRAEAEERYLTYLRTWPGDPRPHYELAVLYAVSGDAHRAIGRLARWWRTTSKTPDVRRWQVAVEARLDPVRDDPRLTALLARES